MNNFIENNNNKVTTINNQNPQSYGLLSMIALVVGIVLGSGVYIVNDRLYTNSEHSTGLSMIAWIVISLIVIFILVSFLEIASITEKTGEPGTVTNWTRHLWNEKTSKHIGLFFPLVYSPIILSGFTVILTNEFLSNFDKFNQIDSGTIILNSYLYSLLIGVIFITLIYGMNAFTSKPGKVFQETGTLIKTIPLFTIILIGFFALVGLFAVDPTDVNDVFQIKPQDNQEFNQNIVIILLLLMPTVMFSYDGFLGAATLQSESKKPSTYKVAAVSGVTFLILIYLFLAFFSFKYGDTDTNVISSFSVYGIIRTIFPSASSWIVPVFSAMIIISIITGLSGNSIAHNRMLADLSANNNISDPNGNLVARNKALVPQGSALMAMGLTLFYFFLFRSLDAISLWMYVLDGNNYGFNNLLYYSYFPIQGFCFDFLTLIAYSVYVFLIIGGIRNRFNKKNEVDKNILFIPFAIISTLVISLVLVVFAYSTFSPGYFEIYSSFLNRDLGTSKYLLTTYILEMIVVIAILSAFILLPYWFDRKSKKLSEEEKRKKAILIKAYRENKVAEKFYN